MPDRDPVTPDRWLYSTKTKYEFQFGYSRAVRHGNVIRVAGTAGLDEDGNPVKGGITDQMRRAPATLEGAVEDPGGRPQGTSLTPAGAVGVGAPGSLPVFPGGRSAGLPPAPP